MNSPRTRWSAPALLAGVVLLFAVTTDAPAQEASETLRACYVPGTGTIYRIGAPGLPSSCLSDAHVEFSWNLKGVAGEPGPAGPPGEPGPEGPPGLRPPPGAGLLPCNRCVDNGSLQVLTDPGLVANSATTATPNNTPEAIVARDGNGDFAARSVSLEVIQTSLSQANTRTLLVNQNDVPFLRIGADNIYLGERAGEATTVASENVGIGDAALRSLTAGTRNTAVGAAAASSVTTGLRNTAVGTLALASLMTQNGNTAVGNSALTVPSAGAGNIAVGDGAGAALVSGSNNVYIGNAGVAVEDQQIRIAPPGTHAATYIAGIRGTATVAADAVPVLISSQGQLGTVSSSVRFKHDIEELDALSARLYDLRPVSFRYLPSIDANQTLTFGLIAEEVEAGMPELVARSEDGQIETVKYHLLAPLLLAEVQRLRQELDAAATREAELATRVARLEARLDALLAR